MAKGRLWARALLAGALTVLAVIASGCAVIGGSPQSVNRPAGDHMRRIWDLFVPIFWLSVLIFVLVTAVLLVALWRFRQRPGEDRHPEQVHGHTRLEIAWTIAPAVILAIIAVPTIALIFELDREPGPEALTVRAIGHQWWWEFQYPEQNVVTANELHVVVGRPVRIELQAVDVIHSFWVPRLAGKRDVIPGWNNVLTFTPEEVGVFPGQCAEFCGVQHANMKFTVVVQTQEEFDSWIRRQQQPAEVPTDPLAVQGREIFLTPANACMGCHAVAGTEARGKVGPDLTHVGSRQILAGGVLDNTPENLARWLKEPQAVKPGNKMVLPREFTDQEVAALVAYLMSLK
jgi:cytochrome c oxidase subunit 2